MINFNHYIFLKTVETEKHTYSFHIGIKQPNKTQLKSILKKVEESNALKYSITDLELIDFAKVVVTREDGYEFLLFDDFYLYGYSIGETLTNEDKISIFSHLGHRVVDALIKTLAFEKDAEQRKEIEELSILYGLNK